MAFRRYNVLALKSRLFYGVEIKIKGSAGEPSYK